MSTLSFSKPSDPAVDPAEEPAVGDPLISCRACGAGLELSQPDADRPELLLGTCTDCGSWHQVRIQSLSTALA